MKYSLYREKLQRYKDEIRKSKGQKRDMDSERSYAYVNTLINTNISLMGYKVSRILNAFGEVK